VNLLSEPEADATDRTAEDNETKRRGSERPKVAKVANAPTISIAVCVELS
jgi:hypothetical protein